MSMIEYAHMKLKIMGSADAIARFHWLMGKLDPDYPMAPIRLRRREAVTVCGTCTGLIYRYPRFSPMEIKMLAKQVNDCHKVKGHVKVKVLMFNLNCDGHVPLEPITKGAS